MREASPASRIVERGFTFLLPALLLAASFPGCTAPGREEKLRQVLAVDPGFADMLNQHRLLLARNQALERELDLKRLMTEQAISQLRQDVAATELGIRRKQAGLNETLAPVRLFLQEDLNRTVQEIRQRELERTQASKMLTRIRNSLKTPGPETDELAAARREVRRLEMEAQGLKAHRDLAQRKLSLLMNP
jgi:hypothetical protein